jgi:hypothetical protein
MHQNKIFLLGLMLGLLISFTGCFGGSDSNTGPAVPTEFVTLSGVLTAPVQLESSLLPNMLQNTDSQVREAYQKAQVYVNGAPNSLFSIVPLSSTPDWQFRIPNVGKAADGKYRVEVVVGRVNLKSLVSAENMNDFRINPETTATLMLADALGKPTTELLASFPSFISSVENSYLEMCKIEAANHAGAIVNSATLTRVIQQQKEFFTGLGDIETTGRLAYLQLSNDIDGDGNQDVIIQPNIENNRIRFKTVLSEKTSILSEIASLEAYSDQRLLQDFQENLTSESRYFAADAANFALGLFFKKSAAADVYLKLFVRRIDLADGVFKGAVVEYKFVETESTAVLTGTKTLLLQGADAVDGAVAATNFVADAEPGPYVLTFISTVAGIGCSSGDTRLVKAKEIAADLTQYRSAETYLEGGGNYYVDTSSALNEWNLNRGIEVGDVFSAYFPNTKNYALFKIKAINSTSITVDYMVNTAENEPRFK